MTDALEIYGKLKEGLHITGYTFERAMFSLKEMLSDDRWKLDGRFNSVNEFLDTLRLEKFRTIAEERKEIAATIKKLQPGASNRQIAKTLGVGSRTVDRDTAPNGAPGGAKAGSAAPSGAQVAAMARRKEVGTVEKKERRERREADLAEKIGALPTTRYGVIVADPEWRFEPWSRQTGMDRAADNHYPTSTLEVIAARDVPSIAAPDCVLFLWATAPMMPHALVVMGAWGFDYRSQVIWAKDRIGTGYWFRNRHELLLVGVRGEVPAPSPGTQWDSFVIAPVAEHSAKPEVFLEMIEAYFPTVPKIELNRRGPARPGWDAWGNEAEAV